MAIHDPVNSMPDVRDGIERLLRSRLCASTPAQLGYIAGLEDDRSWMIEYCDRVKTRRQLCLDRIAEIDGIEVEKPGGAFYMFIRLTDEKWANNDKQFVLDLLHEEHVLVVHGSGFSPEKGIGHFRLVYLADEDTLNIAFDRIDSFLNSPSDGEEVMKWSLQAVMMRTPLIAVFLSVALLPLVSAGTVENPSNLSLEHAIPFLVALVTALVLWKWMIPTQLSGLQVGFEIDDGLYEVHSLTKGRGGVKKLLGLPNVGFGIALYMMAMTGVLLLISELIFDAQVYYLPNLLLMGILVLIPILISPWESLNGQLVGKKLELQKISS